MRIKLDGLLGALWLTLIDRDGFTFRESIEVLPWQHLMVFTPR